MPKNLFDEWLEASASTFIEVPVFRERSGARQLGLDALKEAMADHFVGEATVLKMGGYPKAAETLQNSLPTLKRTQSGDLGELIATEYVDAKTPFRVPVRKLRWKSDRQMPMHGNDVIAIETKGKTVRVLKGEAKSGARLGAGVVAAAAKGLDEHDGRPNPSTLAFITKRLYEENRDDEARVFEKLQAIRAPASKDVQHLIFALAGKDPSTHLAAAPSPKQSAIKRTSVAVVISDHAAFVASAYASHGSKA